jgi:hypothetical protein
MSHLNPIHMNIHLGLDNQRRILLQLYSLAIYTSRIMEELERPWNTLANKECIIDLQQRPQELRNPKKDSIIKSIHSMGMETNKEIEDLIEEKEQEFTLHETRNLRIKLDTWKQRNLFSDIHEDLIL